MKRILITGVNGKVSCAVSKWLTNKLDEFKVKQISIRGDEWQNCNFSKFNVVIHVAGVVPKSGVDKELFYKINYELTEIFAKKCKQDGVKHFIYLSSMSVYGIEPHMCINKGTVVDSTVCTPTSDYGKSKLLAEECLKKLESENFNVTIIRVPSIYGNGKTEYLDQYKHLNEKFARLPKAFLKNYKSIIYIDNLCELIYLIIKSGKCGILCPDDGQISAFAICKAISPNKKDSLLLGKVLSFLKRNNRIRDYFGSVCYSENLTNIFDGCYRVVRLNEAVKSSYER